MGKIGNCLNRGSRGGRGRKSEWNSLLQKKKSRESEFPPTEERGIRI